MTDDDEPRPEDEPQSPRPAPARRENSDKGIGLEMARLFGMNPRQMMAPKPKPEDPPKELRQEPDGAALDVGEAALPGDGEGLTEE